MLLFLAVFIVDLEFILIVQKAPFHSQQNWKNESEKETNDKGFTFSTLPSLTEKCHYK